jgi:hypothetical protein
LDLVNKTPLAARLVVAEVRDDPVRIGVVTAKATYRLTAKGAELDTQDPFPLFNEDTPTELGLLPRDDLPRRDPAFEVILLGAAHGFGGRAVEVQRVGLAVGSERRELLVYGDRVWERGLGGARISNPMPFSRMPLTYENAFGGTAVILVDREAPVLLSDPRNPAGKGIDPGPTAEALGKQLRAPAGYPIYEKTRRLPNIESPKALIERWEDAPDPAGWATVPLSTATHALRAIDTSAMAPAKGPSPRPPPLVLQDGIFHRAHPDWVIRRPERGAKVVLDGLAPEGRIEFRLPALRVLGDYVVDEQEGTLELDPHMLVLLPEQSRFYLVYRASFNLVFEPGAERCVRLRMAEGWGDA